MQITPISDPFRSTDKSNLTELKAELTKLAEEVSRLAAERARQARDLAQAGVDQTRQAVDDYPLTAIAGSFALGALIGLALTSSPRSSRSWNDIPREAAQYVDELRRGIRSSIRESSLADNVEKLASALSATDAKTTIAPAIDRVMSWLSQAGGATRDAIAKATN